MGIFGAGSGGLLVVATGIVELAFPVLRIIDDSVDLLRNSHICLLQELRVGRLLLGLWVGMLSIAAPGKFAGHDCSSTCSHADCHPSLARVASADEINSSICGRDFCK